MVLQCLLTMPDIDGSLGSYVMAKTGLWVALLFTTLLSASDLGTCLAFSRAALTQTCNFWTEVGFSAPKNVFLCLLV